MHLIDSERVQQPDNIGCHHFKRIRPQRFPTLTVPSGVVHIEVAVMTRHLHDHHFD